MMIERAIKLKYAIHNYYYKMIRLIYLADECFVSDEITSDDCNEIKSVLMLFYTTTKYLESNATKKGDDTLLKVVIRLECFTQLLHEQLTRLIHKVETKKLAFSISLDLNKLKEYLKRTNQFAGCKTAVVFHLKHK